MADIDIGVLFSANVDQVDKAEKHVLQAGKRIEGKPLRLDADGKGAVAAMDRVEGEAKKLVSQERALKLDADIEKAAKALDRAKGRLEDLEIKALGGLEVSADIKRAETQLKRLEGQLDGLKSAKSKIEVIADTSKAESELKELESTAEQVGDSAGRSLVGSLDSATRGAGEKVGAVVGGGIEDTLVSALSAIPIAGGIVLAGVAIGKAITGAIQDGLQVEVRQDRLEALTGLSEAAAARVARGAGEAYANVFGESIEANMDTARLATQFDLIDETSTSRDAQKVVQSLAGISDVLGEDVQPIARATSQAIRTGLVKSADEFFDVLAAGARNGVNAGEDLLDTFIEYGTHFRDLGLTAEDALGLMNQGLEGGAFNADKVADALKELTIRVKEGSAPLGDLGLDVDDMARRFAEGGPRAREGLQMILSGLQEIEDPAERSRKAVEIFGTQAEDMAGALAGLDLSTAASQLGLVEGAAQRMFDTLADNDATKIAQAQRNIEVAADGIKGALAGAFAEPLGDLADWVSQNRGPLMEFFADLVNGAIDFGISANEAIGSFVAGPLAGMVQGLSEVARWMQQHEAADGLKEMAQGMRDFESVTDATTEKLEGMRGQFNGFMEGQITLGYLNDAALQTASAIDEVGLAADGSALSIDGLNTNNLAASDSGRALEGQLRNAISALNDEMGAAMAADESQANLTERWHAGTGALAEQLGALGLNEQQVWELIAAYAGVPETEITEIISNTDSETAAAQALADRVASLPDGDISVIAHTDDAETAINWTARHRDAHITVTQSQQALRDGSYGDLNLARGGVVEFMAGGGLRGLTPMQSIAQMVPPSTWRVVGDRGDVPEAYIPLDGSPRSLAILADVLQRMPGLAESMAGMPALTSGVATAGGASPMGLDSATIRALADAIGSTVLRGIALGSRKTAARGAGSVYEGRPR